MSDLYIDGPMLQRVKSNFGRITDLLNGPARKMKDIHPDDMGPDALVERVNEFGDEWEYGIGQLGKFSESAVEALQSIDDAFTQADTMLAEELNKAKESGQ